MRTLSNYPPGVTDADFDDPPCRCRDDCRCDEQPCRCEDECRCTAEDLYPEPYMEWE